jgi:hypothetical protein
MKKLIAGGLAAMVALGITAAAVVPAQAFGMNGPGPWYAHPHYHYYHRGYWGPGPAIGAGILGFAAGAAIAGAAANGDDDGDHVQACLDAYHSYDPRTDSYLGYDGYRHRCDL